jgi:DNA-directed RNA polymerase subunit RPC12/RpoP
MAIEQRTMTVYVCERCEHDWVPRDAEAELPKVCPKCKSPYWNTPRRNASAKPSAKPGAKKASRGKR